ncbi:MAG: hypothetical protein JWP61_2650 [Friedmanniella sp.]|nr:hypothetical protein [Friedmanniella sp.]
MRPRVRCRGVAPILLALTLPMAAVGCSPRPTAPLPPATSPSSPASTSGSATTPLTTAQQRAAQGLVSALLDHGRGRDRAAFDTLLSPRDPAFADRARMLFDNLASLPWADLSVRFDGRQAQLTPDRRARLGPDAWAARATLSWRLQGETAPARQTVWLTFVGAVGAEGGGSGGTGDVRLAGTIDRGDAAAQPLWWVGPVTSLTRSDVTVVVGAGQTAAQWASRAASAATQVRTRLPRGVVTRRTGQLVLEVPASPADFGAVLGAVPTDGYASIAAVTRPEGPAGSAVRVIVNPEAASRLTAGGLGLVLTHELVHVATRSATSPAPRWAVEGLAEDVALAAHPDQQPAQDELLLSRVRTAGAPRALPTDDDFRVGGAGLDLAYAEAWSLCRFVARTSPARLGRLYAELDAGRPLAQATASALRLTPAELTAGWRRDLTRRAARG